MRRREEKREWGDVVDRDDGRIETWGITDPTPPNYGLITVVPKAELVAAEEALQEALDVLVACQAWIVTPSYASAKVSSFLARHGRLPVQSEQEGAAAPNQPKGQHP